MLGLASVATSLPSLFSDHCLNISVLFLVRFKEFWRPLLRVLSDDFLRESMLSSRLCRMVEAFSWPRPIRIEGIFGRSCVHPLLAGFGTCPLSEESLCIIVATGAMAETIKGWGFSFVRQHLVQCPQGVTESSLFPFLFCKLL